MTVSEETRETLSDHLASRCHFEAPIFFYAGDYADCPLPDEGARTRAREFFSKWPLAGKGADAPRCLLYTNAPDTAGRLALAAASNGWSGAVLCIYEDRRLLTTFDRSYFRTELLFPSSFAFPPEEVDFTEEQRTMFYLGLLLYAAGATHALLPAMDLARHAVYGQQKTP